ncbi:MAG: PrgI family protein, partial [Clostridia bacterium]|nr:PrgI family protein [Clostridia bacterium]
MTKTDNNKRQSGRGAQESRYLNPAAEYLPVYKIENGIIYTKDYRYVKIVEVNPINFMLRSPREQRSIIYSFVSFLKISPVKMQFKVISKGADINRHIEMIRREMETETDENCRMLQEDYLELIRRLGSREATTRRFLIAFEYEAEGARRGNEESEAISFLHTAARTAVNFLKQCGNEVLMPEDEDEFLAEVLYSVLCRQTSSTVPFHK